MAEELRDVMTDEPIEELSDRRRLRSNRDIHSKVIQGMTDDVLDDKMRHKIYERNHKIVVMEQQRAFQN